MSDEDEDEHLFEQFDEEVGSREGDPFESLGELEETGANDEESPDEMWNPDREEQLGGDLADPLTDESASAVDTDHDPAGVESNPGQTSTVDADAVAGSQDEEGFGDVGQREGNPFESAEQAFEKMDVGGLDVDSVWDALSDAEARGSVTESQGRTYAEVSKHSYCEHCDYFSAPPDVACSHEGTEILEFIDLETVRVVDCPVVAERRELNDEE